MLHLLFIDGESPPEISCQQNEWVITSAETCQGKSLV